MPFRATGSHADRGCVVIWGNQAPHYAGGELDRASSQRKDPAWVARQLAGTGMLVVPVWRSRSLITGLRDGRPRLVRSIGTATPEVLAAASEICFLGLDGDAPLFAADLSGHSGDAALTLVADGEFVDLRQAGPLLPAPEAALGAYARGILHWLRHNRFCGLCGHASESRHGGHIKRCGNPDCGHEIYPRTDPAVIMLVVEQAPSRGKPARCLLGRNRRFAPGRYSTLAGFVDPGENLEEAVAREVLEEVGVRIDRIAYQASQPWPFPSSIMLGFRAQALTSEIRVDGDEIEDAAWFSADEVRTFGDWGDPGARRQLPRRDSIARLLINTWLAENP